VYKSRCVDLGECIEKTEDSEDVEETCQLLLLVHLVTEVDDDSNDGQQISITTAYNRHRSRPTATGLLACFHRNIVT